MNWIKTYNESVNNREDIIREVQDILLDINDKYHYQLKYVDSITTQDYRSIVTIKYVPSDEELTYHLYKNGKKLEEETIEAINRACDYLGSMGYKVLIRYYGRNNKYGSNIDNLEELRMSLMLI